MKIFAAASYPKKPRTTESQLAAYLYAGLLTVFSLGQLFEFDEFMALFEGFNFFSNAPLSKTIAALIVAGEVLAIPFLLRMRLSSAFRVFSMVLGWIVPFCWLFIAFWINLSSTAATNFGLLGTKVKLAPGWWVVPFCIALCILAAWSSWGLWPLKSKK